MLISEFFSSLCISLKVMCIKHIFDAFYLMFFFHAEMFEHMKNYSKLLEKVSGWLIPGGKLFVHIFTHKWKPYHFEKGIFSSSTILYM